MPRRARSEKDGQLHHVVVRGHNGSPIITSIDDARRLLGRLADSFDKRGVVAWMWGLVINHLHTSAKSPIEELSEAMRVATGPYAQYRNQRSGDRGSFFQDRFWSRPIHTEADAQGTVIYVARNCVTAGHVEDESGLERHQWSGYGALFDPDAEPIIPIDRDTVLELFGPTPELARTAIRERMTGAIAQWHADKTDPTLPAIIRRVAAERGLPPEELRRKSRSRWVTDARMQVVGEAVALGVASSAIAAALNVSRQTVWNLSRRLSRHVDERHDGWRVRLGV